MLMTRVESISCTQQLEAPTTVSGRLVVWYKYVIFIRFTCETQKLWTFCSLSGLATLLGSSMMRKKGIEGALCVLIIPTIQESMSLLPKT